MVCGASFHILYAKVKIIYHIAQNYTSIKKEHRGTGLVCLLGKAIEVSLAWVKKKGEEG